MASQNGWPPTANGWHTQLHTDHESHYQNLSYFQQNGVFSFPQRSDAKLNFHNSSGPKDANESSSNLKIHNSSQKTQEKRITYEAIFYANSFTETSVNTPIFVTVHGEHGRTQTSSFTRTGHVSKIELKSSKYLGKLHKVQMIPKDIGCLWYLEKIIVFENNDNSKISYEFGPGCWLDDSSPLFEFKVMECLRDKSKETHSDVNSKQSDKQLDVVNCQIILDCILSQDNHDLHTTLKKRRNTDVNIPLYGTQDRVLHAAVCTGNIDIVQNLLDMPNVDVNVRGTQNLTPLHTASTLPDMDKILSLLLERGANIEAQDNCGFTPLTLAAHRGHAHNTRLLIEKGANIDARDFENRNILHLATKHTDILEFLLGLEITKHLLSEYDKYGRTPLHCAAEESKQAVHLVLKARADPEARDGYGRYPVHYSAETGKLHCLKELIEWNANVNCEDDFKNRPLHLGCLKSHNNLVKELLANKASISQNIKGESPLHFAAASGAAGIVEALLDKFSSSLDMIDCEGNTAVHIAAREGRVDVVEILLNKHCKICYNWHGNNLLDEAVKHGQEDVVLMLAKRNDWQRYLRPPGCEDGKPQLAEIIKRMPQAAEKFMDQFITEVEDTTEPTDNPLTKLFEHARKKGLRIKTIFERLDTDHSGSLSRDEIKQGLKMMGTDFTDDEVDDIVTLFDKNGDGEINLKELYEKLPQGSAVSFREKRRTMKYNFEYLSGSGEYNPLRTLIKVDAVKKEAFVRCMYHPVLDKMLRISWAKFGVWVYTLNFSIFLLFLCLLTNLVVLEADKYNIGMQAGASTNCSGNSTACHYSMLDANNTSTALHSGHGNLAETIALFILLAMQIIKEIYQFRVQGLLAYLEFDNFIEWGLYIATFAFGLGALSDGLFSDPGDHMQWGSVAVFLAWLDFVLFLQLIPVFGIYVHMIKILLGTLTKVVWILLTFIIAFGLSFYAIKNSVIIFKDAGLSIISTGLMSFGELNYQSTYIDNDQHYDLGVVMLVVFCFLVVIILNNLLIGLAVGDVEAVRRVAKIKQQTMDIELHLHAADSWVSKLCEWRVNLREYIEKEEEGRSHEKLFEWIKTILEIGLVRRDNNRNNTTNDTDKKLSEVKKTVESLQERMETIHHMLETIQMHCFNRDTSMKTNNTNASTKPDVKKVSKRHVKHSRSHSVPNLGHLSDDDSPSDIDQQVTVTEADVDWFTRGFARELAELQQWDSQRVHDHQRIRNKDSRKSTVVQIMSDDDCECLV